MEVTSRELYGGAISVNIPSRFQDVSELREIPDNQEVFTDITTDQSIIVDLLSCAEVSDDESALTHFQQLVEDNEAVGSQVLNTIRLTETDVPNFSTDCYKSLILGQQQIAKYQENARNLVNIFMCLIRIPNVETDILITFNDPVVVDPQSSSRANIVLGEAASAEENVELFKNIIRSLKVNDWSLFG